MREAKTCLSHSLELGPRVTRVPPEPRRKDSLAVALTCARRTAPRSASDLALDVMSFRALLSNKAKKKMRAL